MIWYPASNGDLDRDGAQFRYRESVDMNMATALQAWLKRDDPREAMGAIVLVQYGDGFAIKYLGPEVMTQTELVRRVVWIGDTLREATEPELPE